MIITVSYFCQSYFQSIHLTVDVKLMMFNQTSPKLLKFNFKNHFPEQFQKFEVETFKFSTDERD